MQLNLSHVTFTYPDAPNPVIADVSLTFPTSWTGILGDNGCGKTTLAMICAGILISDSGSVGPKFHSVYCPQDHSVEPAALEDFAISWEADAVRIRELLAIEDSWLWEYGRASGGQRKRVQIACALWQRPDVLILDEPTNDLDSETKRVVQSALKEFKGIGILISHDRCLLDHLVDQCVVFDNGKVSIRPGAYSKVKEQLDLEHRTTIKQRNDARREVKRLETEAKRRSDEARRSKSRLSARNTAKGDSDTRERLGRAKVSGKDGVAGRSSAAMAGRLAKAQESAKGISVSKRYDPEIHSFGSVASAKCLIHCGEGAVKVGDFALHIPEVWVGPVDHIGISGKNGAGKTMLIRHLLTLIPESIKYAYIPQAVGKTQRAKAQETLRKMNAKEAGEVLSLVAKLNSDPARILEGADISPGEMRKLILAEQLQLQPHILILDEPTNHLDIGSITALEEMLATFPGAVLLVSHDAALVAHVCDKRWNLTRSGDASDLVVV